MTAVLNDPVSFAHNILGRELYDYQQKVARSQARTRVLCCGRQSGKSEVLALIAVHAATTRSDQVISIVSGGEDAAVKLLARIREIAADAGYTASFTDDYKNVLAFTNGSRIEALPLSERQIRGNTVNLLIIDEAGMVSDALWDAASATTIAAQPTGRTIVAGTPWGGRDHWFRNLWQRGMEQPDDAVESFHWTSYDAPRVDRQQLDDRKKTIRSDQFRREYMAEWLDESGSFLTTEEINASTLPYTYTTDVTPWPYASQPRGGHVYAGIDWGMSDYNVLACLATLDDNGGLNDHRGNDPIYFIAHLEGHQRLPYQDFVDRIWKVGTHYRFRHVMSETNGVGEAATQILASTRQKVLDTLEGAPKIHRVHTSSESKTDNYGKLKLLLQRRQLVLPQHAELLKQLNNLQYVEQQHGKLKIEVPANVGHDDYTDALSLAVGAITRKSRKVWRDGHSNAIARYWHDMQIHTLDDGTRIPHEPMTLD
ncbi:hypothetical protein BO226_04680 [Rhodococcus sp. 2G]|uniref:terminase large subunit domain-containing protein n=1 Tax=Rhodococcus sp. 2G TaxID=1570939 RepID=UPI00090423B3|nr:terminase family protein [Rhodococcus sp. 2G]APE08603.1 hypothetical protein BO226_04680 [Rhodococcus sp. 2G]